MYILINSVRSLHNVGAIFRTAEAVEIEKIFLGGYSGVVRVGDKYELNPKLKKTALEGINLPWEHCPDALNKIAELKKQGVKVVALELAANSIPYTDIKYDNNTCLVVGHERDGVETNILNIADKVVHIPMHGQGKSLNVAVATSILLYEINRQKNPVAN